MAKVMIVEDEVEILRGLRDFLAHDGYDVNTIATGEGAVQLFDMEKPDLVILDLNLPHTDGLEICRQIRTHSAVPIIMLTARREEVDQVKGLKVGADDYIVKPFSPKVLVLKVKKMLERPPLSDPEMLRFADLEIDLKQYQVRRKGEAVDLSPVEFSLLVTLLRHPKQAFSRDHLIDTIYGGTIPPDIFDRTIDSHIKNVRQKLGKKYIRTVRSIGYQANWELL